MRSGKTIAAKREKPVAESERMRARKRMRLKLALRWLVVLAVLAGVLYLVVRGVMMFIDGVSSARQAEADEGYKVVAEIIDESGAGVSGATRTFVGNLEQDLAEYGYRVARVVLPVGKMREVHVYIEGATGYVKVRTDRGEGVQAEDIDRMLRYLGGQGFEYIDVRTERKGYWK